MLYTHSNCPAKLMSMANSTINDAISHMQKVELDVTGKCVFLQGCSPLDSISHLCIQTDIQALLLDPFPTL